MAEALQQRGMEILTIRCGGMLVSHCVAMSAAGVSAESPLATRQRVCVACAKRRDLLGTTFPFNSVILDGQVRPNDRKRADQVCAGATTTNWMSIEVDGSPLGRYAAYEFLLDNKLLGTDIPDALWPQYVNHLRDTVLTFLAGRRILETERPDHVLVYNRLYSVNHAFCEAARTLGIPSYTLQGGGHIIRRGETMTMFRDTQSLDDVFRTGAWLDYRSAPIGAAEVTLVGEHFSGLLEASSAFAYSSAFSGSQPEDLRKRFAVPEGSKVLLVPMSSEDEINAARLADVLPPGSEVSSLFADQFEWVEFLFGLAVERPDLHLIIRLHPRMFPNKRENVISPIVESLMELLSRAPSNVSLNLPTDDVSLYDLMQIVDVLLNFRSSAGAELSALGIPVVIPANRDFFTYPTELNRVGHSTEEYIAHIDASLAEGWSIEHARRTFRWYAFLFSRVAVDFSESVHARPIAIRPKKPGIRLWAWRKLVWIALQYGPLIRERLALRNRTIAPTSGAVLFDVLEHNRGSLAESAVWQPVDSTVRAETQLLDEYFAALSNTLWKDIDDPRSLAGRVRSHLRVDAPGVKRSTAA